MTDPGYGQYYGYPLQTSVFTGCYFLRSRVS
jgi:hypothetical protein